MESVFMRLDELPSIPSSMDPISTCSTITLPIIGARVIETLPERTQSLNTDGNFKFERDEAPSHSLYHNRGRSVPSFRAYAKRSKSVVSAPGDVPDLRQLRRNNSVTSLDRNSLYPQNGPDLRPPFHETEPPEKIRHPRGQAFRRNTPDLERNESRKRQKVDSKNETYSKSAIKGTENIKESFKVAKGPDRPLVARLPLPGSVEDINKKAVYERKGAFRLRRDKEADEFLFPKTRNRFAPQWRVGDGFSDDEARPNFMSFMAGTHKLRRFQPTPGIGKLQLESEDVSKEDLRGREILCSEMQRLYRHRRSAAKDVWPTMDNFAEEIVVPRRNPAMSKTEAIIPSTVLPQPTPVIGIRETFKYSPPTTRKRKHSDFESFGQRVRRDDLSGITGELELQSARNSSIEQSESGHDEEYEVEEEGDKEEIPLREVSKGYGSSTNYTETADTDLSERI
ncbi:hypothetical protein F4804DRAFT_353942 [Jackrogersella minutella]|nr:hypothetical protein F4804DRAFT_353942 [Jackrogersella minutella]